VSLSASVVSRAFDAAWRSLHRDVESGELPSAVLAVANADETIRTEAMTAPGMAWRVGSDSIFLLASITKPIVATRVLQLVEEGRILLNEPVARYWPEFATNHKETVTLWHLLTHTSGLDEGYTAQFREKAVPDLRAADTAGVRDTFLNYAPGSRYRYCNAAFRVMTHVIEVLTGQDYISSISSGVLTRMDMPNTTFVPDPSSEKVAPVLDFPHAMDAWLALGSPSGGYWSTAPDLISFGQSWLKNGVAGGGRVLSAASVAAATRVQYEGTDDDQPIQPAPVYRGLGWALSGPRRSELIPAGCFGHGGATGTRLLVDPFNQLVLVFLTNRWSQTGFARDRAINAFYGAL